MLGLTIGEKHTSYDFGLRLLSFKVSSPDPFVNEIEIPGMNGSLDLSEALTGEVIYKKRTITAELLMEEQDESQLQARMDSIRNYLHGVAYTICPDMDSLFEYYGRVSVLFSPMGVYQLVTITASVDPYKMKRMDTIVSQLVDTEELVICYNDRKSVVPTITTDSEFTIEFNDISVAVAAGEHVIPDIKFVQGQNVVNCIGTGNITFAYREGSL